MTPGGKGPLTMNKRDLNERDICSKFITPAILAAGWDLTTQIREEVRFTKGRSSSEASWGPEARLSRCPQGAALRANPRQGQARRLHPLLQAEHPLRLREQRRRLRLPRQDPEGRRRRHREDPHPRRVPNPRPASRGVAANTLERSPYTARRYPRHPGESRGLARTAVSIRETHP